MQDSAATDRLDGIKVLVVDDDEDSREILAEILSYAGAEVQSADSAAAAFSAFRDFKPQVMISDIGMPGEDGHSLARRVRAAEAPEATTPLIALTAYARTQDRERALDAGFNLHVTKPFSADHLLHCIRALVVGAAF